MLWPPFWRLPWTASANNPSPPPPPPFGITRTLIPTPQGSLELLSTTQPSHNKNSKPSPPSPPSPSSSSGGLPHLLFLHGGFGSAAVWLRYLTHLSRHHAVPCHALSLRGHGGSRAVGYVRMVFGTGLAAMEEDVRAALEWLASGHGDGVRVALVGHSSGGGLAQWVVARAGGLEGRVEVKGLALLAGTPCFGQIGVYWNWFKHDPYFPIRILFHFYHPLSPLSTLALVKGAFFNHSVPDRTVEEFRQTCMTGYESLVWPNQMMRRFVDPKRVLERIVGWGDGGQKVLVVAGKKDELMGTRLMQETVVEYMGAYVKLVRAKKIDGVEDEVKVLEKEAGTVGQGVRYVESDSAHHLQNDVGWEEGAESLAEFWSQL